MSFKFDYQLFAINTTETMPDEIKTYYDDYLIDCSSPKLVHDQFGQKRPIPAGRGKTIEFRKVSPLPVSTTPLTEKPAADHLHRRGSRTAVRRLC